MIGGNSDVEGAGLVRRSGVGAQSVIEGAHKEAIRLQMKDTRNSVWYTSVVRVSSHDEAQANPFPDKRWGGLPAFIFKSSTSMKGFQR